ncbi:hypothetical protein MRX96_026226 [Rhipicephalus microplus]
MTRILPVAVALIFFVGPIKSAEVYTDQFVVHVEGGAELARELANKHGFEYLGQVFGDHYHLRHKRIAKRSLRRSEEHHRSLEQEPSVRSFSQQTLKRRSKREFRETVLNDPRWSEMWYLNRGKSLDMNVQNVWKRNITGRGVVVTILDDGLEKDHPDLVENYDPQASWDMNNHDPDPQPRYDLVDSNRHGTRCAGEVAAVKNNSICAVGVAFGAGIGGVRMLDGDVTDVVEARSLALNNQHIDVYSASWGPDDDGKTVDGPGELATRAFREGIERGRGGLGSIFVWASGNGGRERDNCNCDGYTNAIWTLSISSATENGLVPWYSEACSSTLATTYSSGSTGERQIITTDLHHGCTSTHTGTSASAPLAAGICALALEANRRLTWRDMQHIVVRTAKPANLHTSDWQKNGVGRNVSHSFGYGLMDADAMVALAKRWTTIPQQKTCMVRAQPMDKYISPKSHVELKLNVNCENVRFLEHVQAKVTLSATRRGDLHIYLTSPAGTRSTLLAQRPLDNSRSGFQAWPFMSVHTWGESPNGRWKLEVHNDGRYFGKATLKEWSLILYGTSEDPDVWSAGAGARPPPQYGDVPSGPHETNEKEAPPTPAAPQTRKTTTKTPPTLRPSPPPVPISPPAKAFPVYRPMKPPPSLGRPPSDHESLDNFIHSDSRRPVESPQPGLSVHGTRENPARGTGVSSSKPIEGSGAAAHGCGAGRPCLECPYPQYATWSGCVDKCPDGTYPSPPSSSLPLAGSSERTTSLACEHCHYSCRACRGPSDDQCMRCFGDADLVDGGYCQSKVLLARLNTAAVWYKAMTVALMTLCVVIVSVAGLVLVTQTNCLTTCCGGPSSSRDATGGRSARYSGLPMHTSTFPEDGVIQAPVTPYRSKDSSTPKMPNVKPYRDDDI